MKEELNSIAQKLAEELSKYTYFMLAASGAAIAYALDHAEGIQITRDLVSLSLALFSWCGSFYFGIRHLNLHRNYMIENAQSILSGETSDEMQNRLDPVVMKMASSSNIQYNLFLIGIIFYIAWLAIEAANA